MGLTKPLQDLVLISWAAATNRTFRDHGGPARVAIDQLADHLEVVAQPLPTDAVWGVARDRAERIFGVPHLPDAPSANGLARLSASLLDRSEAVRSDVAALPGALIELGELVGDGGGWPRTATARSATALIDALLVAGDDLARAEALADATVDPSPEAVGTSIATAGSVLSGLRQIDVGVLTSALGRPEGAALAARLRALLQADELALPLVGELSSIYDAARTVVLDTAPPITPPPPSPVPETPPAEPGTRVVEVAYRDIAEAERRLAELRERLARDEVSDLNIAIHYVEPDDRG